jgi:hypothetical protein
VTQWSSTTDRGAVDGPTGAVRFIVRQLSPLRVRLLVIALLVALPMMVLFAYSTRQQSELDRDRAEEAVQRAAHLIAEYEDRLIAGFRPLLAVVAGAEDARGPACRDYLDGIVGADDSLVSLTVSAPDATVVCSGGRESSTGTDLEGLRDEAARSEFAVGEYRLRPGGGPGVLPIAYSPVQGEDRGYVVVALVNAGWVLDAVQAAGFGAAGRVSVVGPGSQILARYRSVTTGARRLTSLSGCRTTPSSARRSSSHSGSWWRWSLPCSSLCSWGRWWLGSWWNDPFATWPQPPAGSGREISTCGSQLGEGESWRIWRRRSTPWSTASRMTCSAS